MQATPLVVTQARTADLPDCARLLRHVYGADVSGDCPQLLRLYLHDERCGIRLGRLDGEAVAVAVIARRVRLEFSGMVWALEALVVDPRYLGNGYACDMMSGIVSQASRGVCRAVIVDCALQDECRRELLETCGFQEQSRRVCWRPLP